VVKYHGLARRHLLPLGLLMRPLLNGGTLGGRMTSDQSEMHAKTVALALYQIRVLLSGYLGSDNGAAEISVRQAAHLAYALHNEALAIVEGGSFSAEAVAQRLAAVDSMLGSQFAELFNNVLTSADSSQAQPE
jgi:hypothetical protein